MRAKNIHMAGAIFILVVGLLASSGCQENPLRLNLRFDDVEGLVRGDRVVSGMEQMGRVENIKYTDRGDFLVEIVILEKFRNSMTTESKFYLIDDPERDGKMAIGVELGRGGGELLEDGAVVEGVSRAEVVAGRVWKDLEGTIKEFEKGFRSLAESLARDLKGIPESDEYKRLKRKMDRLAEEMQKAGKEAKEKLQKEIIPRIEQELEKLKRWLENRGRQEEIKPLETQLKQLKEI